MAKINLLPWRAERRKELLNQFLAMLGLSVLLMAALIGLVIFHYSNMQGNQISRNNYIKSEIKAVEKQIAEINNLAKQKKDLLARMEVIQQLQRNRPEIVHLFEELVLIMPEGVHMKSLKQNGKNLIINGEALSNARVSALMRNINASDWLTQPVLEVIKQDKKDAGRSFVLKAMQKSPEPVASNQNKKKRK